MERVYVCFGSNIEREANIGGGLRALAERFGALAVSTIYACPAVGFEGDAFYNGVAGFDTDEPVADVHAALHAIEARLGRDRRHPKFSPRTLDLDLLLFGDRILRNDELVLPRPEIDQVAFVLAPLAELAMDRLHPVHNEPFTRLWARFDGTGVGELIPVDRTTVVDADILG